MEEIRTKFLIIGAGPVGLFFAIKLIQKRCARPDEIVFLESRTNFSREQIMVINNQTLMLLPEELRKRIFDNEGAPGGYILPPLYNNKAEVYKKQSNIRLPNSFAKNDPTWTVAPASASITTKVLQEYMTVYLLEQAQYDHGVKIYFGADNLKSLDSTTLFFTTEKGKKEYRVKYDFIIGADGTRSFVRNNILKDADYFQALNLNSRRNNKEASGLIILLKDTSGSKRYIKNNINNSTRINYTFRTTKPPQHWKRLFRNKDNNIYLGIQVTDTIARELNHRNLERLFATNPRLRNLQFLINRAEYITDPHNNNREGRIPLDKLLSIIAYAIVGAIKSADLNPENIEIKSIATREIIPSVVRSMEGVEPQKRNTFIVGDAFYGTNFFSGSGVNVGILYADRIVDFLCKWLRGNRYANNRESYDRAWGDLYRELVVDAEERINDLKTISSSRNVIGRVL